MISRAFGSKLSRPLVKPRVKKMRLQYKTSTSTCPTGQVRYTCVIFSLVKLSREKIPNKRFPSHATQKETRFTGPWETQFPSLVISSTRKLFRWRARFPAWCTSVQQKLYGNRFSRPLNWLQGYRFSRA